MLIICTIQLLDNGILIKILNNPTPAFVSFGIHRVVILFVLTNKILLTFMPSINFS